MKAVFYFFTSLNASKFTFSEPEIYSVRIAFKMDNFLEEECIAKYAEALQLEDIEAKKDPETEPYKSKYTARKIYHDLLTALNEISQSNSDENSENFVKIAAVTGLLLYKLGVNYIDCEEATDGEQHLSKALIVLEAFKLHPLTINTLQKVYCQFGFLWTSRRQQKKAQEYLEKGEEVYKQYKEQCGIGPYVCDELLTKSTENLDSETLNRKRMDNFESDYTHTLYYLAQVYGALEDTDKSAEYCCLTLTRQLNANDYQPLDWALNAATLSQYYMTNCDYKTARHCLAAANVILAETGEVPDQEPSEDEGEAEKNDREKIPRGCADIARCWSKYGLSILEASKEKVLREHEQTGALLASAQNAENSTSSIDFNLDVTNTEDNITANLVLDFEEARKVFLCVQRWLNSAKEFYKLDGHCTDYVEIIQDYSKVFKLLSFFEMDFERQCKMHKRRIDLLDAVLNELSQQHYLLICRQLIYEIAETYAAILDIKSAIIESDPTMRTPHAIKKINMLAANSIKYYVRYMDTLRDMKTKKLPDKFCEDDERPALVAQFCIGRLYGKFFSPDVQQTFQNKKTSFEYYKFLVDYCKKHDDAKEKMKAEYEICVEMVDLLPAKLDQIRAQLN
ncbi:unnamed protein product [Owenia fusiformis]|uniref:KIF-binding protein n=1 Tax=Owenia fusiformis TaxID=6347 RepID=A0A8S4PH24_OWEFU|nr:unnamed protein product [Owenia fusiformis]